MYEVHPPPNLKCALSPEHRDKEREKQREGKSEPEVAANHHDPGRCMGNLPSPLRFVIGTASRIRSFGPNKVHS